MAQAPADRVGLTHKGRIAPARTPTWRCSPRRVEFVVDPDRLLHRNPVSAYAGRRLTGVVRQTWLHGHPIEGDGEPRGQLLQRGQQ